MASVGPVESSKTFEILPNRALLDEDLVLYGIAMGEDQELHQIVKRSLWAFVSAPCEESTDQLRFPLGYPPAFTDYSVVVKFWEQEAGRVGISVSVECPLSGAEADDDLIRQAAWILFYVDQFAKRVTGQPHND